MPTILKIGDYAPEPDGEETHMPNIYIDHEVMELLDDQERYIAQFTYEELKAILAILEAERNKHSFILLNKAKNN